MLEESQKRHWILRTSFITLSLISIILALVQFATIANSDDECDWPLREWLVGTGTILIIAAIPVILIESCLWSYLKTRGMKYYKAVYIVIISFLSFWTALGLFMLSDDNKCARSFETGYDTFMGTTGAFFIIMTLTISFFSLAYALDWLKSEKLQYQTV